MEEDDEAAVAAAAAALAEEEEEQQPAPKKRGRRKKMNSDDESAPAGISEIMNKKRRGKRGAGAGDDLVDDVDFNAQQQRDRENGQRAQQVWVVLKNKKGFASA